MADIEWDISDFESKASAEIEKVKRNTMQAVNDVATTILALSQLEVPHDIGILQNSGVVKPAQEIEDPEAIVGYNTPYAAYQHEGHRRDGTHIIKNYQGGRKGKYLEDPIRNNLRVFRDYFTKLLG